MFNKMQLKQKCKEVTQIFPYFIAYFKSQIIVGTKVPFGKPQEKSATT